MGSLFFGLGTDGVDVDKDVWKITVSDMFETIGIGFQLQRTQTAPNFAFGEILRGSRLLICGDNYTNVEPETRVRLVVAERCRHGRHTNVIFPYFDGIIDSLPFGKLT